MRPRTLAPLLLPTISLGAAEHLRFDSSYQTYEEANGRIAVESWYYRGEMNLTDETLFKFQLLRDAISGASPTGALPGGTQPFLSDVEDVRNGILGALSHQFGDHRVEVEFSRSKEHDYLSYGLSLSDRWELNQKNTTLSMGLNYLDDSIVVLGIEDQSKKSYDLFFGVTQLLDKNTVLAANLTVGYSEGYLNDPYKAIQRTDIVSVSDGMGGMIDFPTTNLYRENRPDSRLRGVLQLQGTRFFDKFQAALDATVRLSTDDYGVFSQSLQVEWRQALGSRLELTPFFRYYRQNAADFFHNTLDDVSVADPAEYPSGRGPHYSADYRLSSMSSLSLGLKARWRVSDNISLSAAYELYDMSGTGSQQAPAQAYPTASIWTFGVTIEF
ncbi:DUF3570 domain-containing protein [Prosthecobacter fusiformis]|nr:DUF3570 domain-containing protein [Prosthecobacter fusiformis]